ncbi:MAG: DUF4091 domain-containing protein [Alloprevotella sp.]|nr:DUF4091 domain-containing protein [Alloprevotella sp.]
MRKHLPTLLAAMLYAAGLFAQDYAEMNDGVKADPEKWAKLENKLYMSWASRDVHYVKTAVPQLRMKSDTIVYAWRGERIGVEALLFSPVSVGKLSLALKPESGGEWLHEVSTARFLRYVMTDDFKSCGKHPTDLTPRLVPDVIDLENAFPLGACQTRPVWVTIDVPRDIPSGEYVLTLRAEGGNADIPGDRSLRLRLVVVDRTLPPPSEYAFHLDFWQQPYSVSRYYGVERWSDQHLELLRPYMQLLARGGQKVVSAILFYEPWGDQSHDKFSAMVQTTKRRDGTWSYDYTIFDRWVEFMASCGISRQIDCFSMVPWDMTFRYYDETQGRDVNLKTTTSAADYKELWSNFLISFAQHLREKGWFDKTLIAMDERGLSNMLDAYAIAQEAVPGMKMALAGNYHKELTDKLADYCVAFGQHFSASELEARRAKGWHSTFYTSCAEREPNIFSNSLPAEATYLPLYGIANGFDGYLHWSWLNWQDTPLTDTRFRLFAPGDTYSIYPGPRSSVRWERFIEGVQQAEKVRILRAEYKDKGNTVALSKLESAVAAFQPGILTYMEPASRLVNYLESVVNGAPEPPVEDVFEYCPIMLSETNRSVAIEKRWLTSASTTGCEHNLSYTATSPSLTGYCVAEEGFAVRPGTSFSLNLQATQNDDDLRYCRLLAAADWNCDSIFSTTEGSAERIAFLGTAKTSNTNLLNTNITIHVPDDAVPGPSRLRLCYADAWSTLPQPCGELTKGFAMDIPMQIVDNTGIATPTLDTRQSSLELTRTGDTILLSAPARLYVYTPDGALLDHTPLLSAYSLHDYLPGTYLLTAVADGGRRTSCKILK